MDYLISTEGKRQLILDGYLFSNQRTNNDNSITWECVERRNGGLCAARVKTLIDQVIARLNHPHTHAPNPVKIAGS